MYYIPYLFLPQVYFICAYIFTCVWFVVICYSQTRPKEILVKQMSPSYLATTPRPKYTSKAHMAVPRKLFMN